MRGVRVCKETELSSLEDEMTVSLEVVRINCKLFKRVQTSDVIKDEHGKQWLS